MLIHSVEEDAVFKQPAYEADDDSDGDFDEEEEIQAEQQKLLGGMSESDLLAKESEMSIDELKRLYGKGSGMPSASI